MKVSIGQLVVGMELANGGIMLGALLLLVHDIRGRETTVETLAKAAIAAAVPMFAGILVILS